MIVVWCVALCVVLCFSSRVLHAQLISLSTVNPDGQTVYVIRLTNGDMLTGTVRKIITLTKSNREAEDGIILQTQMGDLTIYASEIAEITMRSRLYRHAHRIYIMPTAEPIGTNHFVGVWQLLLLYGGAGIGNISLTAGRSWIPTVPAEEQLTLVNGKVTVYNDVIDGSGNRAAFALGGNLAFANAQNLIGNIYGVATFTSSRSSITGLVFTKVNDQSLYTVRARDFLNATLRYAPGAVGIGVGVDTKFSERHDVHFIGELWNPDLTRLANTGFVLGLRLCNTSLSMDVGLALVPQPFLLPFVSFAWTPF
jgi:hypothetical protein